MQTHTHIHKQSSDSESESRRKTDEKRSAKRKKFPEILRKGERESKIVMAVQKLHRLEVLQNGLRADQTCSSVWNSNMRFQCAESFVSLLVACLLTSFSSSVELFIL